MVNSKGLKELRAYEQELHAIKRELKTLPDGYLVEQKGFYYVKVGSTQKGITKDPPKIMQLARKAYLERRLEHLEWNYSLAKKQSGRYKAEDPLEIIRSLPRGYQMLPHDYFFHPSVRAQAEKKAKGNAGYVDGLIYRTDSGICVRSKSERTIANALDKNEITYHYEAALVLGNATRYPDFTIFRPFGGKKVLWEHLGRMDKDEYRQNAIGKLSLYAVHGFFPFDNLICTYEQDLLDPAHIQVLIEAHLLQ